MVVMVTMVTMVTMATMVVMVTMVTEGDMVILRMMYKVIMTYY